MTTVRTLCGNCHSNCGILVEVEAGRITKIAGNPEHPANLGALCPKGLVGHHLVYHPQRLKYPLLRTGARGEGKWRRVSWDEAYDYIAQKLQEIKQEFGPQALAMLRGAPVVRDVRFGFGRFLNAFGSPNFAGVGHACSVARSVAHKWTYGGIPVPDPERAQCIVVWGSNPVFSNYRGITWGMSFVEAKWRGAKLVVVDPRFSETAAKADLWISLRPGTDGALALGLINVLISENLYNLEFVNQWTLGFEELSEMVKEYPPETVEIITGVPADRVRNLARLLINGPTSIYESNGIDMHTNTAQTTRAICCLRGILGDMDVPGGHIFLSEAPLVKYQTVKKLEVEPVQKDKYPLMGVAQSAVIDAVLTGKPYPIKGLMVNHTNPMLINAGEDIVREAFLTVDFVLVIDLFMTKTAELADIVLPAATYLEETFFNAYTDTKGAYLALRQKVVEPLGETKSEWDIETELARRIGLNEYYPWNNVEEFMDYAFKPSGVSVSDLKANSVVYVTPPVEYQKYLGRGFSTPSGKLELFSRKFAEYGYNPLPDYREPDESPVSKPEVAKNYPLIATTGRYVNVYTHTSHRNISRLREMAPEPYVRVNPLDAKQLGISDGEMVTVESLRGQIKLKCRVGNEFRAGVVGVDFGWGNPWDGGANCNKLTDFYMRDQITSSPANRDFLCRINKC